MRYFLHHTCPHHDLMYTWTFLLIYLTVEYGEASSEAHYECGPHGRFEYCIDGIPGCVIGCHCHPGYYFDTESKICEPNVKLTNDYRRHFYLQPTRSPPSSLEPLTSPTPTTTNLIEEKVDAIAKDADDLGDWLYNQFFKTIENQVINNTDGKAPTRRSGNDVVEPTPKRRSRRKGKKKSKKKRIGKKFTKKGLRRKLLRITEDDSLFDSGSDSSSDESSDSSDSDSDTSEESDKDHDHRKIIMINKKPPSPLPSFIFLPNVETPFYPPIGLPPPPIVPMYPMVPVPPVGSFYPGHCENDTTTTVTPAPTTKETVVTTVSSETEPTTTTKEPDLSTTEETPITDLRSNKREQQNKLMHKLRNKLKKRNKNINQFQLQELQETLPDDIDPTSPMQFRSQPMYDGGPPMDDVDFKYLSQLIHKVDLNKTQPEFMFNSKIYEIPNINPGVPMRRNYAAPNSQPEYFHTKPKINRPASKADETNDSYYSNLGKQIASLIRKVDTGGERQINIELEQGNVKSPMQTIFHENSYSPRSYWERFVRSPLKQKQMYKGDIGVYSSENLFDLENKVNIATTIERILSLQELENIANLMEMAKSETINRPPRPMRPAVNPTARRSNQLNVNLLAPLSGFTSSSSSFGKNNMMKQKEASSEQNPLTTHQYSNPKYNLQNSMAFTHHTNNIQENDMRNSENIKQKELHNELKSQISHLQHQVSGPAQKNFTNPKVHVAQQVFKYQQNPMMLNYRSMNYVGNSHKQYNPQHSILPLPIYSDSTHSAKSLPGNDRPSYFHHEYNRFDYFN